MSELPEGPEGPEYLLSAVLDPEGFQIYLHMDKEGLDRIIQTFTDLRNALDQRDCEHDHLFSPDWGGWDLSNKMPDEDKAAGCQQIHHIKLCGWNDKWRKKHKL